MDGVGAPEHARAAMPSYAAVLRAPAFRAIFAAATLSTWGDYIARVTIAAVVLTRTGSALATASTFAVSLLPTIFGRSLLGALADRIPYKHLLVCCHLLRAALVGVLILAVTGGASLPVLLLLLFVLELAGGPAAAANQILLTDLFADRRLYMRAYGLGTLADQVNQAIGLAVGGVVVTALGATRGLWFDLVTFLVSAVVVSVVIRARPPDGRPSVGVGGFFRDLGAGAAYLARHRVLLALLGLSIFATWGITAPEAVALPYAVAVTGSARLGGVLMAAPIVGTVVGLLLLGRWQPERQNSRIIGMALLMPLPLLLTVLTPSLPVACLLWFTCGVLQAFMLPLQSTFSLVVPAAMRGRVFGLAGAVAVGSTGVTFLAAGWVCQHTTPAAAVGICAVVSLGCIVLLAARWPAGALRRVVDAAYNS